MIVCSFLQLPRAGDHLVRYIRSYASETKPFQGGNDKTKRRNSLKQAFLINSSDAEIFMYLIERIRFGSWKDRRLNGAYDVQGNLDTTKWQGIGKICSL